MSFEIPKLTYTVGNTINKNKKHVPTIIIIVIIIIIIITGGSSSINSSMHCFLGLYWTVIEKYQAVKMLFRLLFRWIKHD